MLVQKKYLKRHYKVNHIPHFTPLVFMVQGIGALTSVLGSNHLSAFFFSGPIVFSHLLMNKREWGVWGGEVVKSQSQAAGKLFANLETNGNLNGITVEFN